MKSHSSLLSMGNLTKPCLSRQVFQGSRRWAGGGNATVRGLKPSRQCSQPGSLNPGAALESDGTVKLIKHSQASSKERAKRGCSRLRPKYGQRSGSGRLTWPDANDAPPVYRVDLTHPVENAEHGKAAGIPPGRFPGKPTARQAPGKRHGEDRKSQGRSVMDRICPRRSGLSWQESQRNRLKREKQMTSDACRLVRPGAVTSGCAAHHGRRQVLPSGAMKAGCVLVRQPYLSRSGPSRTRAALERLEPYEGNTFTYGS